MASAPRALWRDPAVSVEDRVEALLAELTREEKLAQLGSTWTDRPGEGGDVAPESSTMANDRAFSALIEHGLGQITRAYGSKPITAAAGAANLAAKQAEIVAASRFGIPAQVHEECLTGFAAWGATVYPAPLCWGATFDPRLIERMAGKIATTMRRAGVHQGLAPVVDVTRDYRWGRTEETVGEDPYLVGVIGSAYVRGLEQAGLVATLKHFAGYSSSRGGRNLAPVSIGPRELAEVILPPFEMALRHGAARSVMNSYAAIDGLPAAASEALLTGILRDSWGFAGTVVADYFAIRFLETQHAIAADGRQAATLALRAGIDVELPGTDAYGEPLRRALDEGAIEEELVDRAVRRSLRQKIELGLLDEAFVAVPEPEGAVLDDDEGRELALAVARESIVLLRNRDQRLPLRPEQKVALVGPTGDRALSLLGCYAFPNHVGSHPELGLGVDLPSPAAELAGRLPRLTVTEGCGIDDGDTLGIADAVRAATTADVCVLAVGDRSGLFGRGTSGEGCDAPDLRLPGHQPELVRRVLATGTPTVLLLIAGRPYALGPEVDAAEAMVAAFFPGQRGGQAIAEVLTGAVNPSGRLPVSVPRNGGAIPGTYLAPQLSRRSNVSSVDPTPAFAFGHGLSYTWFAWGRARIVSSSGEAWPIGTEVELAVRITNTGPRAGAEVVQIYLRDLAAQTIRPDRRLIAFQRVELEAGASAEVRVRLHSDLTALVGREGTWVVEPGAVELVAARSSTGSEATFPLQLTGELTTVGHGRRLLAESTIQVG